MKMKKIIALAVTGVCICVAAALYFVTDEKQSDKNDQITPPITAEKSVNAHGVTSQDVMDFSPKASSKHSDVTKANVYYCIEVDLNHDDANAIARLTNCGDGDFDATVSSPSGKKQHITAPIKVHMAAHSEKWLRLTSSDIAWSASSATGDFTNDGILRFDDLPPPSH